MLGHGLRDRRMIGPGLGRPEYLVFVNKLPQKSFRICAALCRVTFKRLVFEIFKQIGGLHYQWHIKTFPFIPDKSCRCKTGGLVVV